MNQFSIDLSKWVNKTKSNIDTLVRESVQELGKRIVYKTPVGDPDYWISKPPRGYVGGRARGNWQYGFSRPPSGSLPDIDSSGGVSTSRITEGVKSSPAAGMHYIANNLPYAERLENGWSHRQAPHGMVRLAVVEFQDIVKSGLGKLR